MQACLQMMLVFDEISGALKAFSRSRSQKQFPGALQKTEKINSGAQIPRFSIQERYNFYPPCFFFKFFNLIAGTDLMYQTASALCPLCHFLTFYACVVCKSRKRACFRWWVKRVTNFNNKMKKKVNS